MTLRTAIVDLESAFPNLTSQYAMPRHGVLALGTAIRQSGYDVEVYVESLNGVDFTRLLAMDVVGFAVTAPNLSRVAALARERPCRTIPRNAA